MFTKDENLQTIIKRKINQYLKDLKINVTFLSHTNFKILVFLYLLVYSYRKMTKLNISNRNSYQIIDFIHIFLLFIFKNYYQKKERTNLFNISSFFTLVFFNRMCIGPSEKTLSEDYFFSASGNLFLIYFFL
jgi:uncharacterized membrane protein